MSRTVRNAKAHQESQPNPPGTESPVRPLLVSIEDAAEILAVGRTSIYQLVWDEQLVPIRIGRCLRFSVEQLEQFVEDRQLSSLPTATH